MGLYLKSSIGDYVLTAIASISLSYVLLDGFYVSSMLQKSPIPALVALVCLVVLFAVGRNKRTILVGGIIYAVALFVVWIVCAALTPAGGLFVDNEQNYLIFSMVVTLTPTLCYVLSRAHVGTALVFIVGAFMLGLIQLFYQQFELLWTVLFVLSSLSLIIYRNYQRSVRGSLAVQTVSFAPGFLVALASCALACGVGLVVWFGIISPLNPDALDIKLVTEYRALETKEVRGTAEEFQTPNVDMTSDVTNDDARTTDDIKEDLSGTAWPATGETEEEPDDGETNNSLLGMNLDNFQEAFDLQSNPQNWPLVALLGLIVLLIVLYFVLRRVHRNRRLESFKARGAHVEFERTFMFLLERFRRLGVSIPNGQTMLEFGVSSAAAVRIHDEQAGVSFNDLAACYARMAYGKREPNSEDLSNIETYYKSFWKASRKMLGNIKYFFKSFTL